MRLRLALLLLAAASAPASAPAQSAPAGSAPAAVVPMPPATRATDQADDYHGRRVADPYRWLEDTDSPETAAWVEAQNAVTFAYLTGIPEREPIRRRLTELWNFERFSTPFRRAGRYFYFRNDGLQSQSVLYTQPSLDAPPTVLLDPNTMSADGTVALSMTAVSHDGRHLAYGTSTSGSDWQEFRVRAVADGRDLDDHLRWIKFSGASWTRDGKGFFYSRYPEPTGAALTQSNRNQALYYHRLGTPQSADVLAFAQPDHPERGVGAQVTDDGRYAIRGLCQGSATKNGVYVMDLADSPGSTRRWCGCSTALTPSTASSGTTARSSTCRPTWTHRAGGSSPSTCAGPTGAPGARSCPRGRTCSPVPRSSPIRWCCSTCGMPARCCAWYGSTARQCGKWTCPPWAR